MFRTDKKELSIEDIQHFIRLYLKKIARYRKLENYYRGHHEVLDRASVNKTYTNKLVHPYPKYITDFNTGFFMGKGIKYIAADEDSSEDDEFLEKYQDICKYNNERKENLGIAKSCSIKGDSYELLWIDENSQVRFKEVEPENAFLIYSDSLDEEPVFGVRFYSLDSDGQNVKYVELYDRSGKKVYKTDSKGDTVVVAEEPHYFDGVPLIHFKNNEEMQGDFEQVISLIDAYNAEQSNTLDDMDEFSDAYLALINYQATDKDDIDKMKKNKVLLLDDNGNAKWLIKDVNDGWIENFKLRLNKDIHKFSFTPDFSDEAFGTNVPGVSLRLKMLTSEELRNTKEMYFREAIRKRMDLIGNYLNIINTKELTRGLVEMQFSDSLPQNLLEITQIMRNLASDLSTETRLSLLPFISDPADEMAKKEKEDSENIENSMSMYKKLGAENDQEQEQEE